LIAEVKRASPSAGDIAAVDPTAQAVAYARAGAAAISVLTEPDHFGGTLEDLRAVRGAVERPLLRKDFLVHPDQVLEARGAGADTVLLIAACLDDDELTAMLAAARDLGMEPIVETHSDRDLERVLATDARIVGVNARDLETLVVDLPAALARLARIGDRLAVCESGIRTRDDVRAAVAAGASAILVGEALMRAPDPEATVRELIHGKEPMS
jgi:indole-3-glycerol phosphate synthase